VDNKTERYMIIFNDVGLTIKGYYQELIDPIQRKKILDRLYSLIHRELFEGVQPLEEQTTTVSNGGVTAIPAAQVTAEPKVKRAYKHKAKYLRKKNKTEKLKPISMIEHPVSAPSDMEMTGVVTSTTEPKDPVYDNEKDDNQYDEMKRKGLI